MRNEQTPRGIRRLHMTRADRSPAREKELAPPPTREEARAANAGELAPRGLTKKVLDLAKKHPVLTAGAALATIAGGFAAVEAYQGNIPGIHRSIDQSVPSNEVLNPTATEGAIKPSMIERLPQKEIDKMYPDAFGKLAKDTTVVGVPPKSGDAAVSVAVSNDQINTLQMEYPLDLSLSTKPNAEIQFTKRFAGGPQVVRETFQGKGYYDIVEFPDVPGGTKILAPVDGFLVISRDIDSTGNSRPSNGVADTSTVLVDFTTKDGYQYRIGIAGGTDLGGDPRFAKTGFVFKSLIDAPIFSKEDNKKLVGTYGKQIKKGETILEVIQPTNGNPVEVALVIYSALKGRNTNEERATILNSPLALTNIEFFTDPAGKLLLPQR